MPNSVKGLGGLFAKYPLGFSPASGGRPETYGIILGAGASASARETSSKDGARFMDFYLASTSAGSSDVYGLNIDLDAQGTSSGYAIKSTGKISTGTKKAQPLFLVA